LGVVTPDVEAGAPSPSQPLAVVPKTVEVTIGGKTATTLFAGLTSGFAGLYQINAIVPDGVAPGDAVVVTVTAGGQTSLPVTIAVQ